MSKTVVIYYSGKGNNQYLAHQIADALSCDIEKIRPRIDLPLLFILKMGFGIKKLKHDLQVFDRVILCGPVWMGRFITPLRSFVKRYDSSIRNLIFVTCCGTNDAQKNERFGHGLVFDEVRQMLGEKCTGTFALPISMVYPADDQPDSEAIMNTRLNDDTFKGEFRKRFDQLISSLQ